MNDILAFIKFARNKLPQIKFVRNPTIYKTPTCWGVEISKPVCKWILSYRGYSIHVLPAQETIEATNFLRDNLEYWRDNYFEATKGQDRKVVGLIKPTVSPSIEDN